METNYYENLEENFTQAMKLFETEQTHEELLEYLKSGNITQRQISAIKFDKISNSQDADILTDNLTGQDGKIREAVSVKIADFTANIEYRDFFKSEQNYQKFLDALTDINGNICRNILKVIDNFVQEDDFRCFFIPRLLELTNDLADKVLSFGNQDGKYKVNKDSFKLYWCLEAIYVLAQKIELEELTKILKKAKSVQDYTIREKVAKILTFEISSTELDKIRAELKNDDNYYVKRY